MPTVYRIRCDSCGKAPAIREKVAGHVTFDGRKDGIILPESYQALKLPNGEFACLPHPSESASLRRHGYTWIRASREGRLYIMTYRICRKCGAWHEQPAHDDWHAGCLVGYFSWPVLTLGLKFGARQSWAVAIFQGYLVSLGIALLIGWAQSLRWRRDNLRLKIQRCPDCQSEDLASFRDAAAGPLLCPGCHTPNLRISVAGKS